MHSETLKEHRFILIQSVPLPACYSLSLPILRPSSGMSVQNLTEEDIIRDTCVKEQFESK